MRPAEKIASEKKNRPPEKKKFFPQETAQSQQASAMTLVFRPKPPDFFSAYRVFFHFFCNPLKNKAFSNIAGLKKSVKIAETPTGRGLTKNGLKQIL